MKKKNVFRKIAVLLSLALIINMGVFDMLTIESKAASMTSDDNNVHSQVEVDSDITISGDLYVGEFGKITVESGKTLTVTNNLNCHGKIDNYGTIIVTGTAKVYGPGSNMSTGTYFKNYSGSVLKIGSAEGSSYSSFDISDRNRYFAQIMNEGTAIVTGSNITGDLLKAINNTGSGKLIFGNTYYNTSNLGLDATVSGTQSNVVAAPGGRAVYVSKATITPPSGWHISTDPNGTPLEKLEITETPSSDFRYYLFEDGTSYHTEGKSVNAFYVRTSADEPTGNPYVITNPDSKEGNFYWTYAGVKPADGYTELDFYIGEDKQFSATPANEHQFMTSARGYKVRLKDADGLYTQMYDMEDINIVPGNPSPYDIYGDPYDETDDGLVYATYMKIVGKEGYKVILSGDYEANNSASGSDEITINKSINNCKFYIKAPGDNKWLGPIERGNVKIGLDVPSNPYTITGKKYKDKFYESDVEITPAEGYKIATSKNGAASNKIKLTKTTKDLKIYLVKEVENDDHIIDRTVYSEPITVGDIYILREGEGKVTVNDLFYGGRVIPVVSTKTNDIKKVSYKYKKAEGGDYLKEVPSEIGKYVVEATFEMTDDYKELVVKDEFEINYLPAPAAPYTLEGTLGENNIYTSNVKITPAEGYKISKTIKTGYVDSIELDKNADTGYVYLQKKSTGEMTDKIAIKEILIDKEEPVVTGISNNEVIYTESKQIIVKDDNLFEVSVNGVKVAVSNGQAVIDLSSDNGIMDYTIIMTDKAGNTSTIYVTLITSWMKDGNVQEGVPLKLYPGYTYNFPEGSTWTVEGDPTVYKGGNKFVVTSNVEIKFKKN